jgi:HicB_like antitoxin of bacterial toxin-antitoxin system
MRFPLAIEIGTGDLAFGVVVPDLPGCFSAGDTLDDALNKRRRPSPPGSIPRSMTAMRSPRLPRWTPCAKTRASLAGRLASSTCPTMYSMIALRG